MSSTVFLLLALLLLAAGLSFAVYGVLASSSGAAPFEGRMKTLLLTTAATDPVLLEETVERRYENRYLHALHRVSNLLNPFIPARIRKGVRRQLLMAGLLSWLKEGEFVALQVLFIGLAVLVAMPLFLFLKGSSAAVAIALPALIGFIIAVLPYFFLARQIETRQNEIRRALPDVVDLLVVSVEAGAGFDGALQLVSEKMKGPLAQEFDRALQEMKLGKPRANALRDMAARTGVEEVASFVAAVCQADQLGVGMAQVLRMQTQVIRQKRLYHLREAAQKLTVKLLLPLILCVFPAIMVVVMGPSVLTIMKTMLK